MKNKRDILFEEMLVEMFKRVGLEFTYKECIEYTKEQGSEWYLTKTWTQAEQEDFAQWLIRRMRVKLKWNKSYCEKVARTELFNFGWTFSDYPTMEATNAEAS